MKMGDPKKYIEGKIKGNLNKLTDVNFDKVKFKILEFMWDEKTIK